MPHFRLAAHIKIRHGFLSELLTSKGWSQRQLAEEVGVGQTEVCAWMMLKRAPKNPAVLRRLMELTGIASEDLFPPEAYTQTPILDMTVYRDVETHALQEHFRAQYALEAPDAALLREEQRDAFYAVLATLSEKEQRLLVLRFGLDGSPPQTREQIGTVLRVSRERIAQIEAQAIRKLRHPSRGFHLKQAVYGEDFINYKRK